MVGDFLTMDDIDLYNRTVLVRVDINSPINPLTGELLDYSRVKLHIPTLKELEDSKTVILAHQSRPGKGDFTSLEKHAAIVEKLLGRPIEFIDELISRRALERISAMTRGEVVMLENTRLYSEEVAIKNDISLMASSLLIKRLSSVGEIFINDAFAAAHRAQPSLVGFAEYLPMAAGRLLEHEITALSKVTGGKGHPTVGILGGAKIDDSIDIAMKMVSEGKVDSILATGVVANALLHASGVDIGEGNLSFVKKSTDNWEKTEEAAKKLMAQYADVVKVPVDVALEREGRRVDVPVNEISGPKEPIYDIGINTIERYSEEIRKAAYLFMNGPAGYFEKEEFSIGTTEIFMAVAESRAYSVMGGGHTGAMVEKLGIKERIDHVSSGGGAFINFLAGREMPVITALKKSMERYTQGYYNIIRER